MPENPAPLSDEELYIEMEKRRLQRRIILRDGALPARPSRKRLGKLRIDRLAILVLGLVFVIMGIYFSSYRH